MLKQKKYKFLEFKKRKNKSFPFGNLFCIIELGDVMGSLYIHIPFCKTICSYCDFCKVFYQTKWVIPYIEQLKKEFESKQSITSFKTIYLGGGTPNSLSLEELEYLLSWIDTIPKEELYEYTIECNIEFITKEQLTLFAKHGINRISVGIQTIHENELKKMNRNHTKEEVVKKLNWIKQAGITNINVDLMYAFPKETLQELEEDLTFFLTLPVTHISTYSLMIEPNTKFYIEKIEPISEELDSDMYDLICKTLKKYGFQHYEISNFCKEGYHSLHNLTYWKNKEYYGIGVGASGYFNNIRYTNTKSLTSYLTGTISTQQELITERLKREYELILGLRLTDGISVEQYKQDYRIDLLKQIGIIQLLKQELLVYQNGRLLIPETKLYISNEVFVNLIEMEEL